MSFRYFVLGLLTRQPMSGYDVKRFLKHLDWLIDSPSLGSVYPALHALLKDELVTVRVILNEDRPARKVYSATATGRRALQSWISEPRDSGGSLRAFLMHLMLADSLSHTDLVACLRQRRSQVAVHRAILEQAFRVQDQTVRQLQDLAFDFGLTAATAELVWLDSTLERLSQEYPLGEDALA